MQEGPPQSYNIWCKYLKQLNAFEGVTRRDISGPSFPTPLGYPGRTPITSVDSNCRDTPAGRAPTSWLQHSTWASLYTKGRSGSAQLDSFHFFSTVMHIEFISLPSCQLKSFSLIHKSLVFHPSFPVPTLTSRVPPGPTASGTSLCRFATCRDLAGIQPKIQNF